MMMMMMMVYGSAFGPRGARPSPGQMISGVVYRLDF